MILYDAQIEEPMRDYGILIPMSMTRRTRILEHLKIAGCRLPILSFEEAIAEAALEGDTDLTKADLERVHSASYIAGVLGERGPAVQEKAILDCYELVNSDGSYNRYDPSQALRPLRELVKGSLSRCRGSYLACRLALADRTPGPLEGFCFYMGGGSHHPRYDRPSGFGLLNDPIVSTMKIAAEGRAKLIWYIDLDAHKGDGSAELLRFARDRGELRSPVDLLGGSKPGCPGLDEKCAILYLSIHMKHGWPLDAESLRSAEIARAPLVPNDLDIGIDSGEEGQYLEKLQEALEYLARISGSMRPGLVVVEAGMDVYEKDALPGTRFLNLTLEQCLERDRFMFRWVRENAYKSAWFMAGGYGEDVWEPTARFLENL